MRSDKVTRDPTTLGLAALGWTLGDATRAERLLALTGLTPVDLRERATDPAVLGAILAFLEAHQPDLIACADSIGVKPEALVAARMEMEA